jgi:hypothetical protein
MTGIIEPLLKRDEPVRLSVIRQMIPGNVLFAIGLGKDIPGSFEV